MIKKKLSPIVIYSLGVATAFFLVVGSMVARRLLAPSGQEITRVTSPDGLVDAVVIEDDPGSLSSYDRYLFLVEKGTKIKSIEERANMKTSEGDTPIVVWTAPHFLSVDPGNAHIIFFDNIWYSYSLKPSGYNVELDVNQSTSRHYLQPNGRLHGLR